MGDLHKVRFELEDGPVSGETVWAEKVGEDAYRLQNAPYYALGYAENDVVRCVERDGWQEVVGLLEDSGNGTVRLLFANSQSADAQEVLEELASVGASYERASDRLVAVTVPPNIDVPFSQLANYLNDLSDDVLVGWEVGKQLTRRDV